MSKLLDSELSPAALAECHLHDAEDRARDAKESAASMPLAAAIESAAEAHYIDLRGQFPMATRVLSAEVYRLRGELDATVKDASMAQELLAHLVALEACYCEVNAYATDIGFSREQRDHHRRVLIAARAAIAKAQP